MEPRTPVPSPPACGLFSCWGGSGQDFETRRRRGSRWTRSEAGGGQGDRRRARGLERRLRGRLPGHLGPAGGRAAGQAARGRRQLHRRQEPARQARHRRRRRRGARRAPDRADRAHLRQGRRGDRGEGDHRLHPPARDDRLQGRDHGRQGRSTPSSSSSIARLPGVDALRGQLVGLAAAPLTGVVRGLNGLIQGLATQLGQIAEQGLVGGEAPAAEEPPPRRPPAAEAEAEAPPRRRRGRGQAEEAAAEEAGGRRRAETSEKPRETEGEEEAAAEAEADVRGPPKRGCRRD